MKKHPCFQVGEWLTPLSPGYDTARLEWNRRINRFPAIILYPETTEEVAEAVLYAHQSGLPVRVRSGGHNYEGYSVGDAVVVIDVHKLKKITFHEHTQTLVVGAGVRNEDVYGFLAPKGYLFPGGTCPTVGVSGLVLGGGWGLTVRQLGLGCDSLTAMTVVLPNGCIQTVSKTEHPSLFWVLQGGGNGNFGVVIDFTFQIHRAPSVVTLCE
ncbi:MAG: FAD-binding oxidoreductase [Bacilli bacterium]